MCGGKAARTDSWRPPIPNESMPGRAYLTGNGVCSRL
jgi:hypothetical protein